eukprot:TRINITY_DN8346_c0_g1_i3.p1 TRINITY_DN8346_c0_g1~~TRINITY_DN8346_c0_g1_i3.p1  ORF type:complete len:337 (-),score=72.73 TRINITY_DN8346_c0_g1_i3:138-1148(-)
MTENSTGNGKVVCVTGASGFIASWLVRLLLDRGYCVRGTVLNLDCPSETDHLLALEGANERLQLLAANLLEEGSFDEAVSGCECVFHTASPTLFGTINDPQAELVDPAVKGTVNVLRSCKKASSVKRVVMTSSIGAMIYNGRPRTSDVIVDETWFSDAEYCTKNKFWYPLSKTLAEEAAWEFSKMNNLDLVTINPAMVIGFSLQPTLNSSSATILNLIDGSPTFPDMAFGWVNVKDVAEAHILAFEITSASGRYLLVERVAHFSEIVRLLSSIYPGVTLPAKCADSDPYGGSFKISKDTYKPSKERAEMLGLKFTPLEDSLKETITSFVEKKLFKL